MKKKTLQAIALLLILGSVLGAGAYYWGTSTIVADTSPPVIKEQASTSGAIAYGSGKPTLLLFVSENLGIESAEVEIKTMGGWLGVGSETVETLTMEYVSKTTSTTYKYRAKLTKQLEQNTEYQVIYRVYDQADHGDTWTTTIETVNLDGIVRVNGIEVQGPDDKIYVKSLELGIQVEITQGENTVNRIYGRVNGQELDFSQTPSDIWISSYTLPEEGSYSFLIQVLDTSGTDTQLASFNVQLGSSYQREILIVLAIGLAVALGYGYMKQREDAK